MWNRNAHRVPEQRRHRKPVRQPADHTGFGSRANDAEQRDASAERHDVTRFECSRDDEQNRCANEEPGRAALHQVELCLTRGLVVDNLHGGDGHLAVTLTCEMSMMCVLAPAGTSTYSTTARPPISFTVTSIVARAALEATNVTRDLRLDQEAFLHH